MRFLRMENEFGYAQNFETSIRSAAVPINRL
jgi:hypothetical protein